MHGLLSIAVWQCSHRLTDSDGAGAVVSSGVWLGQDPLLSALRSLAEPAPAGAGLGPSGSCWLSAGSRLQLLATGGSPLWLVSRLRPAREIETPPRRALQSYNTVT